VINKNAQRSDLTHREPVDSPIDPSRKYGSLGHLPVGETKFLHGQKEKVMFTTNNVSKRSPFIYPKQKLNEESPRVSTNEFVKNRMPPNQLIDHHVPR